VAVDRLRAPREFGDIALGGLAVGLALLVGVGIGNQDRGLLLILGALLGASIVVVSCVRPQFAFWVLIATTITQPFIAVSETRGMNPVDALLFPTLVGAWIARPRPAGFESLSGDVVRARRNLVNAVLAYLALAVLSLVVLAGRGYPGYAGSSFLVLFRCVQGLLFFKLVERMVRTREDLNHVRTAIVVGFVAAMVVNAIGLATLGVMRAGAAWNILVGDYFISGPNEAGFGVVFLWAIVLAFPFRRGPMVLLLLLSLVFLAATSSRSALLAWVTFVIVWGIRGRRGWMLLAPLGLIALFPLLPEAWTGKIVKSLVMQRGSFESYSTLVRFYAWQTALNMFLHFPWLGVGYDSFRFFSREFNALTLNLGAAENFVFETAAGLGIGGVAIVVWMARALRRLGKSVQGAMPEGTRAYALAKLSGPFLVAVAVANMTGDNLIGMMGVAQLAVFSALLVTAARIETPPLAEPRTWMPATE
jgi:O-antigen ligase